MNTAVSSGTRRAVRLIVGMTGATGAPLGVRLLEVLRDLDDVETHLVLSRWAPPPSSWRPPTPHARL